MNGVVELAKLFKARENVVNSGVQLGRVVSPLPDIKVALGDKILLTKEHLIFGAHMLRSYKRNCSITGSMAFSDVNAAFSAEGEIEFTDALKAGDRVIIIPTKDEQKYYVLDKAVSV